MSSPAAALVVVLVELPPFQIGWLSLRSVDSFPLRQENEDLGAPTHAH